MRQLHLVIINILVYCSYKCSANPLSGLSHQRLVKDVIDNYDARVRPVSEPWRAVNVSFRMELYQILEITESSQSVSLYMWMTESWQDEVIQWNPKKYNNMNEVVVSADSVWRPDTYLYNSVDMGARMRVTSARIIMPEYRNATHWAATVKLQYPGILSFSCNLFLMYFPFDIQNCSLEFASWIYDLKGINYVPDAPHVHMENFIPSTEWTVISFQCHRIVKKYNCCPEPYVSLHYHLVIKRKPLFYVVNLILPTLIIAIIALVGFFFPSHASGEREEKVSLGISTLLAMSVFLLMVSDKMPITSDFVPYIGLFYIGIIGFIATATFFTSLIIVVQQQGKYGYDIPPSIRRLIFDKVVRFVSQRGLFYIGIIGFIATATFFTSLIIVVQQQGKYGYDIPPWIRRLMFDKVARFIILRAPDFPDTKKKRKVPEIRLSTTTTEMRNLHQSNGPSPHRQSRNNSHQPGTPNPSPISNYISGSPRPVDTTHFSFNLPSNTNLATSGNINSSNNNNNNNTSDNAGRNYNSEVLRCVLDLRRETSQLLRWRTEDEEQTVREMEWEWLASILEQLAIIAFLIALIVFALVTMKGS